MSDSNSNGTNDWDTFRDWLPGARIAAVHIRNFRGIVDLKIVDWDRRRTLFLIGPNGSGKSTALYALRWLFGDENFVDSGKCEPKPLAESDAAIAVEGGTENHQYREFFTWGTDGETGVSVLFVKYEQPKKENDKKESQAKISKAFALRRTKSKKWTYCTFQIKGDDKRYLGRPEDERNPESDILAQEMGIHMLSLSPTESSVQDAPKEVRKIIREYLKNVFSPKKSMIPVDLKGVTEHDKLIKIVDSGSKLLLESFENAVSSVSHDLGIQVYETKIELSISDAETAIDKHLSRESIFEVLMEKLMGNVGVIPKQVDSHPGNQSGQAEKGHSAGTLQSLALLNLYGWLEAMRKYSDHEGALFLLFLEEPEVFLHPQWARVFSDTLADLGEDSDDTASKMPVQAMVTTHSPIFARVDRHEQLQIHRVEHDTERRYRVYAYSREEREESSINKIEERLSRLAEFHPGVTELFFAKRVVLVEGLTELWLFPAFARWLWRKEWLDPKNIRGGEDPTYNTTLVPCGPTYMKSIFEMLSQIGVKPIVVHDFDPLKGLESRNRNIEKMVTYYGNPKTQLRRLNPDLEGVMGYREGKPKAYKALLFLTWLFKGDYYFEENERKELDKSPFLASFIQDWDGDFGDHRKYKYPFSPLVTRGTCGVPTVGSNFLYLLDVITEIYTPLGNKRTRKTWQTSKMEFIHYLRRRGILTVKGQIIKPETISVGGK